MENRNDNKYHGYGKNRKRLLLLIRILNIPSPKGYIIWEAIDEWISKEEQKIEDERIDKVYLEKYGKTYKEYYAE